MLRSARNDSIECYQEDPEKRRCITNHLNEYIAFCQSSLCAILPFEMDEQIEQAIETLKRGGIVAFPTDTVYGLGANAFDDDAVAKVYRAKKRPRHLALALLLGDV